MTVKLLTKQHLEFLSLKGGCTGSSESIHVKMPHCWKSHVAAHMSVYLEQWLSYLVIRVGSLECIIQFNIVWQCVESSQSLLLISLLL